MDAAVGAGGDGGDGDGGGEETGVSGVSIFVVDSVESDCATAAAPDLISDSNSLAACTTHKTHFESINILQHYKKQIKGKK